MKSFAILNDVTRCTGCEQCVLACKEAHGLDLEDAPWRWQDSPGELSAQRWTTILHAAGGRNLRDQCRHCREAACVAACPVGALHGTPEGAVVYDPAICLGCRYCILACPFRAVRFAYGDASPTVGKCVLCHEQIASGRREQPACTAACPGGAAVFGTREEMLAEAHRRIAERPDLYVDHVWGEHEAGGTAVLHIADVDLAGLLWPRGLTEDPVTELTHTIMGTIPFTFFGVSLGLAGLGWVIRRRQKLAREEEK